MIIKNKRGLSTVVTTLIIVLLVLVAVGIIWAVIANLLESGAEEISTGKFTLAMQINSAVLDGDAGTVEVIVMRKPGEGEIDGIKFALEGGGKTKTHDETSEEAKLQEFDSESFTIDYDNLGLSTVEKVSIYPIFSNGNYGDLLDEYVIGSGDSEDTTPPEITELSIFGEELSVEKEYVCGQECFIPSITTGDQFFVNLEAKDDNNIESYSIEISVFKFDENIREYVIEGTFSCGEAGLSTTPIGTYTESDKSCPFNKPPTYEGKVELEVEVVDEFENLAASSDLCYFDV